MEEKKIAIIGVGNCGCQVANLAERKYPELFDCVYINTSEADLSMVDTINTNLKFKIGEKIEGSGKNRSKMKEYLMGGIKNLLSSADFIDTIKSKDYMFICASAAGGTGSGAAPALVEVLRSAFPDTPVILIGVLPPLSASLMEQGNAIEFLSELYEVLGDNTTYMLYDNDAASDKAPTRALQIINENIVEDLRVLSGVDNYATPYESIDEADMESIITTAGRLMVVRVNKNLTEKILEDTPIDEIIIKAIKDSAHAEIDRNKRVVRWGIITNFTEAVNKVYNGEMKNLEDFLGIPVERFNHNAVNPGKDNTNFLYVIASGLTPINDRVQKITDRIEELKSALNSGDNGYILNGNNSYGAMSERKKIDVRNNAPAKLHTSEIIKKFMNHGQSE